MVGNWLGGAGSKGREVGALYLLTEAADWMTTPPLAQPGAALAGDATKPAASKPATVRSRNDR